MHSFWYLGRSAGFISYSLLWLTVLLGLAVRSRVFDGFINRGWVFEFHRFLSLVVLGAVLFHALIMLPDPYAHFRPVELLVPFRSHLDPLPMALGIISLYGSVAVTLSFYQRELIGQRAWRLLHYLTFGVYLLALAHALLNGSDSSGVLARAFYFASLLSVIFFLFYRLLATRRPLSNASPSLPPPASSRTRALASVTRRPARLR
jgi:predicted ferric reductase